MRMISFDCVDKSYQIKETAEGIRNAFYAFFKPKYKTIQAVQDVSFKIDRSKTLGLIGENGAGKTTIIKLVCGILAPDAGHIEVWEWIPFKKSGISNRESPYYWGIKINFGGISQLTNPF